MTPEAVEPVVCAGTDIIQDELEKGRKKIKEIDGRLDNVETKLDSVETKVDIAIEHSAHCLKDGEFKSITSRLGGIETLLLDTNQRIIDMSSDKAKLEEQMGERVCATR